ncbi:MAG: hypothetical protein IIX50_06210, partial [Bacteroidaceae bacterium]|nr:hypothetical protein [Bacteroidaceae bacterium]
MRKISLLLVTLFCTMFAAQAQTVTDLSQLNNDATYTLRSERAILLYSEAVPGKLCSSTGKSVGSVSYNAEDPNQQFRIEKKGSDYYLYSVGAEKYVGADGSYTANASAVLKIENVGGDYPWKLCLGGNGMNSQTSGQTNEGILVNSWTTSDPGNCYKIEVAVVKAKTYTIDVLGAEEGGVTFEGKEYKDGETFEAKGLKKGDLAATAIEGQIAVVNIDGTTVYVSYMAADTKFYTLRGGHGGYVSLGEGYTSGGSLLLTKTDSPKDNKGLWAFVRQSDGAYKVYNFSTGLSKVLGFTGSEADARATMVAEGAEGYTTAFDGSVKFDGTEGYIKLKGTTNYWNKRGNFLALWNSGGQPTGDQGSKFYLNEAEYVSYPDEYIHEISDIKGVESYEPKNPNTLWYTTSAEAA